MLLAEVAFESLVVPLCGAALVCFMLTALNYGRAEGYRAAERKFAHMVRCDDVVAPLGPHDHEHRCVRPALGCAPRRGRPEHLCRCNMRWIDRDDRSEVPTGA